MDGISSTSTWYHVTGMCKNNILTLKVVYGGTTLTGTPVSLGGGSGGLYRGINDIWVGDATANRGFKGYVDDIKISVLDTHLKYVGVQ